MLCVAVAVARAGEGPGLGTHGGPWGKAVGSADSTRCAEPRLVRVSGQRLVDALVFLAASALAFASAFAFAASFFF